MQSISGLWCAGIVAIASTIGGSLGIGAICGAPDVFQRIIATKFRARYSPKCQSTRGIIHVLQLRSAIRLGSACQSAVSAWHAHFVHSLGCVNGVVYHGFMIHM